MKKITGVVIAALLLSSYARAQTEMLKHTWYTTTYDKKLHYPVKVEWWDYQARCACAQPIARKDQFAPDPKDPANTNLAKGYNQINKSHRDHPDKDNGNGKGYDRGHMCPAADNQCMGAKAQAECFYYSNMAPQTPSLNRGDWKSLETYTRKLVVADDSVHVWAGSVGVAETDGTINVPTKCWKVIYIMKTKTYEAYIFDNNYDKPEGKNWQSHWKVTVPDVEKLTGFKFKS